MSNFIRRFGRAIIAVLVLIFSGLFGDADPTAFEGFLENLYANGEISITGIGTLLIHYIGDVRLKLFDPTPPEETNTSGTAAMLLALMLPAGLATHAPTPADLQGPVHSGETVTEVLADQTHASGDVSLLKHRPLYKPADA